MKDIKKPKPETKPKIIKKYGAYIFVDNQNREWWIDNLKDLVNIVRNLSEANRVARYYFR